VLDCSPGELPRLERFRALPRLDDKPVGSVVCFFVDRHVRSQRVTLGLLNAAVEYARSQRAKIIEGYPMKPGPRLYTYMGSPSTFLRQGSATRRLADRSARSCAILLPSCSTTVAS